MGLLLFAALPASAQTITNTFPDHGNVGIGTTTPGTNAFARIAEIRGLDAALYLSSTQTSPAGKSFALASTYDGTKGFFSLYDLGASQHRLTVDDSGHVGIGTINPGASLEVRRDQNAPTYVLARNTGTGATSAAGFYAVNNGNAGVSLSITGSYSSSVALNFPNFGVLGADSTIAGLSIYTAGASAPILFGTAATERMRITPTGNVGIGTGASNIAGFGSNRVLSVQSGPNVNSYSILELAGSPAGTTGSSITGAVAFVQSTGGAYSSGIYGYRDGGDTNHALGFWTDSFASPMVVIRSGGNVGIGTTGPDGRLHVHTASAGSVTAHSTADDLVVENSGAAGISILNPDGNAGRLIFGSPSNNQNAMIYGDYNGGSPILQGVANGNVGWTVDSSGNVGIGTATPSHKLAVNGAVRAKEVIVDTGWADYVFAKGYRLAPLAEVERHIEEHQHLPGIPSAKAVAEHGVSIGEMQAKLLAKIEELTLHVIRQEKKIEAQQAKIQALEARQQQ